MKGRKKKEIVVKNSIKLNTPQIFNQITSYDFSKRGDFDVSGKSFDYYLS